MTRDEAKVLVAEYLTKLEVGRPFKLVVRDHLTREEDFGWVFFYNTQKFVETDDVQWALAGNSPLIVDRHTGELHVTGTAHPIKHYIDQYRQRHASDITPPSRLRQTCERARLEIIAVHSKKWSVDFRKKWRDTFAAPDVGWKRVKFEWDVLDTPLAPALARRAAIRRYDDLRSNALVAFVSTLAYAEGVCEVRGQLPAHSWWRQEIGASDLYIVEADWRWSFVMTHEEVGYGIGPFTVLSREPEGASAIDE